MSRSGYVEDCGSNYIFLYRGMVERAIRGRRSQAFLRELAKDLDAMPEKRLIKDELVSDIGECCTIGAYCKARRIDTKKVDATDADAVGALVDIPLSVAAEIEYENDEHSGNETPEERWVRMRKWVEDSLIFQAPAAPRLLGSNGVD